MRPAPQKRDRVARVRTDDFDHEPVEPSREAVQRAAALVFDDDDTRRAEQLVHDQRG
jgi:predicted subunit of tRNA(5-methylaminomethyl-2-thiouridylate) methyltransferase